MTYVQAEFFNFIILLANGHAKVGVLIASLRSVLQRGSDELMVALDAQPLRVRLSFEEV